MDKAVNSVDVADPSDWLGSTVPKLAPVESSLRCQVCKDFFDTPMITSCSHTFCSLCIRRCLTNDGKCPACRATDQELRLRRNCAVQEIVDAFQIARPSLTSLAAGVAEQSKTKKPQRKRKLEDTDLEDGDDRCKMVVGRRKTRSQSEHRPRSLEAPSSQTTEDSVQLEPNVPEKDDGLAACPICGQKMKEEAVFLHLDTHNKPLSAEEPRPPGFKRSPSIEIVGRSRAKYKASERLPQINYSLMKDPALRKKLSEMGIPNTGPRALLIRRHAEWVNIVNANADSLRPKSKREMLRELDVWDRSTGRSIMNGGADGSNSLSIMSKDFDGVAWSVDHKVDFQDLVSKARHGGRPSNSPRPKQSTDQAPQEEEEKISTSAANHASFADSISDNQISTISSSDTVI
ncbi:MAG: hypothetical protein Q9170_001205 [Blastenia crenularia]